MLQDDVTFNISSFLEDYRSNYVNEIKDTYGDNISFSFTINEENVAIAYMPIPIPLSDIEVTAQFSYNWKSVLEDTKEHKAHLIVSIMQGSQNKINRFKIFTQILCSLLRTTNSIGVYKGLQSLLIQKEDYLLQSELIKYEYLPLDLWIYIGLRGIDKGNYGYTYGLKEFDKSEMEVLNSSRSVQEIRDFLFNTAQYVLKNDVTFKEGETVGISEEEKIGVKFSKGEFVEGETFKFAF